jgi:hypothetical protein
MHYFENKVRLFQTEICTSGSMLMSRKSAVLTEVLRVLHFLHAATMFRLQRVRVPCVSEYMAACAEFSDLQFRLQHKRNTESRRVEDQVFAYSTNAIDESHERVLRHYRAAEMAPADFYTCVLECEKSRTDQISVLELARQAACSRNFQNNQILFQIAMREFKAGML